MTQKKTRSGRTLRSVETDVDDRLPVRVAELITETVNEHGGEIAFLVEEAVAQVCAIALITNKTPAAVLKFLAEHAPNDVVWPENALAILLEGNDDSNG